MIKHIVMFQVKESLEGRPKRELIDQAVEKFNALTEQIPYLKIFEVGVNTNTGPAAYDLVINSSFDDEAQLQDYQVHPAHEEVKTCLGPFWKNVAVVDYEA